MTDDTTPKPGRAQLFEILRDTVTEEQPMPKRPEYLDASVADAMISRAMSSFRTPPCAIDPDAQAQPKPQQTRAGLTRLSARST